MTSDETGLEARPTPDRGTWIRVGVLAVVFVALFLPAFSRMVYVGDGYTDIPCFSLIRKQKGIAIGVYDPASREKWRRAWEFVEDQRVSNLLPADFSKGSALEQSLLMAVDRLARDIRGRNEPQA